MREPAVSHLTVKETLDPLALRPAVSGGLPAVCGRAGIVLRLRHAPPQWCTLAPIALCPAVSHGLPKPPPAHLLAGRPRKRRGSSFLLAFADKIYILSQFFARRYAPLPCPARRRGAKGPKTQKNRPPAYRKAAVCSKIAQQSKSREKFLLRGFFWPAKLLPNGAGFAIIRVEIGAPACGVGRCLFP